MPLGKLFGGVHESRGAPGQQEMEHQPHGERERRHPSRPVERLLQHLRASFRLVALEIVGEKQAAGSSGTQLVALAAHQDAGVPRAARCRSGSTVIPARRSRTATAAWSRSNCGKHRGDLLSHPGASRRLDDGVPVIRQRGERDFVVVRQHRDLVLRRREIALEQQIFERALQAGHLLGQPLAAVFLRRALGLRHVIEQVHGAQYRGEAQQDERDRELERRRNAHGHRVARARSAALISAVPPEVPARARSSMSTPARSSFASTIKRHEPASGYRQFRCRPAEHPEIFLAGRNVQALLRLQELLAGRLLAYAHASRRVLGIALHVIRRVEPAGQAAPGSPWAACR